jgi:hypothetical protein
VWDSGLNVISPANNEENLSGGLFGDAETRAFYEDLPDLLSLVPLTILGLTPEQAIRVIVEISKYLFYLAGRCFKRGVGVKT